MAKADVNNLSVSEIQKRLQSIEQDRQALERALMQAAQKKKQDLVKEIKDLIKSRGHDIEDVAELFVSRKRSAPKTRKGVKRSYARYADPDNPKNVYSRGVLPGWLREGMESKGLDPTSKKDRDEYKQKYLEQVA